MGEFIEFLKDQNVGKMSIIVVGIVLFILEYSHLFKGLWVRNNSKEVKALREQKKHLKKRKRNKLQHKFLKSKIDRIDFIVLTGYEWAAKERKRFFRFSKSINSQIGLKSSMMLFLNSKITDGVLMVKATKITKFECFSLYFMIVAMLYAAVSLVWLSFYITKSIEAGKTTFFIMAFVALLIAFFTFKNLHKKKIEFGMLKEEFDGMESGNF